MAAGKGLLGFGLNAWTFTGLKEVSHGCRLIRTPLSYGTTRLNNGAVCIFGQDFYNLGHYTMIQGACTRLVLQSRTALTVTAGAPTPGRLFAKNAWMFRRLKSVSRGAIFMRTPLQFGTTELNMATVANATFYGFTYQRQITSILNLYTQGQIGMTAQAGANYPASLAARSGLVLNGVAAPHGVVHLVALAARSGLVLHGVAAPHGVVHLEGAGTKMAAVGGGDLTTELMYNQSIPHKSVMSVKTWTLLGSGPVNLTLVPNIFRIGVTDSILPPDDDGTIITLPTWNLQDTSNVWIKLYPNANAPHEAVFYYYGFGEVLISGDAQTLLKGTTTPQPTIDEGE